MTTVTCVPDDFPRPKPGTLTLVANRLILAIALMRTQPRHEELANHIEYLICYVEDMQKRGFVYRLTMVLLAKDIALALEATTKELERAKTPLLEAIEGYLAEAWEYALECEKPNETDRVYTLRPNINLPPSDKGQAHD